MEVCRWDAVRVGCKEYCGGRGSRFEQQHNQRQQDTKISHAHNQYVRLSPTRSRPHRPSLGGRFSRRNAEAEAGGQRMGEQKQHIT